MIAAKQIAVKRETRRRVKRASRAAMGRAAKHWTRATSSQRNGKGRWSVQGRNGNGGGIFFGRQECLPHLAVAPDHAVVGVVQEGDDDVDQEPSFQQVLIEQPAADAEDENEDSEAQSPAGGEVAEDSEGAGGEGLAAVD